MSEDLECRTRCSLEGRIMARNRGRHRRKFPMTPVHGTRSVAGLCIRMNRDRPTRLEPHGGWIERAKFKRSSRG
jgi:hypothetical protein